MLNQAFAIVRHADRLDHKEADWKDHPDRASFPNDPPLTQSGQDHARQVGDVLKKSAKPWKVIISSPYYRCAQTASCLAQRLDIPVHFDLDLGEVFDRHSMHGDCDGAPQHRQANDLQAKLQEEFPTVKYVSGENGILKMEGREQRWEETWHAAKMRFGYKVKKLIQQAAAELNSIIIVSHGDAITAVLSLLQETWIIKEVPYAAYFIAERKVRILKHGTNKVLTDAPVYVNHEYSAHGRANKVLKEEQWKLTMDPTIEYEDCRKSQMTDLTQMTKMRQEHHKDLVNLQNQKRILGSCYSLDPDRHCEVKDCLDAMGSSARDSTFLLGKANTTTFGQSSRILCKPGAEPDPTTSMQSVDSQGNIFGAPPKLLGSTPATSGVGKTDETAICQNSI